MDERHELIERLPGAISVKKSNRTALWKWAFGSVALVVLVLALMPPVPHMPTTGWDKANHLLAFAVLAWLGSHAYPQRLALVLSGLLAYGALIEILQSFTTYRSTDWHDLLADGLGLVLGWLRITMNSTADYDRKSPPEATRFHQQVIYC